MYAHFLYMFSLQIRTFLHIFMCRTHWNLYTKGGLCVFPKSNLKYRFGFHIKMKNFFPRCKKKRIGILKSFVSGTWILDRDKSVHWKGFLISSFSKWFHSNSKNIISKSAPGNLMEKQKKQLNVYGNNVPFLQLHYKNIYMAPDLGSSMRLYNNYYLTCEWKRRKKVYFMKNHIRSNKVLGKGVEKSVYQILNIL